MLYVVAFQVFTRVQGEWVFGEEQLVADSQEEALDMLTDACRACLKHAGKDDCRDGWGQVRMMSTILPVRDAEQLREGIDRGRRQAEAQVEGARYMIEDTNDLCEEIIREGEADGAK